MIDGRSMGITQETVDRFDSELVEDRRSRRSPPPVRPFRSPKPVSARQRKRDAAVSRILGMKV
jgi:hypothetical protein